MKKVGFRLGARHQAWFLKEFMMTSLLLYVQYRLRTRLITLTQSMLFTLLAFTLSDTRNVPQATRSTVRVGYRVVRAHWN
jgi:hypothetical protein